MGFVSQTTTSNGSVTAKCLEFKPNIDLNISLIYYMARIILKSKISQTVVSHVDRSIKSINIPYGITQIWDYVFIQCYRLPSVTIPDSSVAYWESGFLFISMHF